LGWILYGNNKWQLNPDHYLDLLIQRPMAFNSARPIRQWRESWSEALQQFFKRLCHVHGETKGIKDFISVLMLYRNFSVSEVEAAVELALENNLSSSQGVLHLLIYANDGTSVAAPLNGWESLPTPDLDQYGQLGGVQ